MTAAKTSGMNADAAGWRGRRARICGIAVAGFAVIC